MIEHGVLSRQSKHTYRAYVHIKSFYFNHSHTAELGDTCPDELHNKYLLNNKGKISKFLFKKIFVMKFCYLHFIIFTQMFSTMIESKSCNFQNAILFLL